MDEMGDRNVPPPLFDLCLSVESVVPFEPSVLFVVPSWGSGRGLYFQGIRSLNGSLGT